jgi:hypothetical protein
MRALHCLLERERNFRPFAAQYPKSTASSQLNEAMSHAWPGKYLRFGDNGTRPLTATTPMITHSNASAALDHGRATKTANEERKDIVLPMLLPQTVLSYARRHASAARQTAALFCPRSKDYLLNSSSIGRRKPSAKRFVWLAMPITAMSSVNI